MNKEKYYKTLLSPHVTEKASMRLGENAQTVFKVAKDAKKIDIKKAIEDLFNTKVDSVRVINMKGKSRRTRNGIGKKNDWKKAYVTLATGEEIDFSMGTEE